MSETASSRPESGVAPQYPIVPAQPSYPELEEEVLQYWRDDGTFEASVKANPPDSEFVFYDGPPFANGLPHYGHLLTGFVKDAVPRYQTMRGRRVERRFGWDCHGLPAEMEAEKELGISGRQQVTEYGIGRFNAYCRQIVHRTTDAWEGYVNRQARWVDFEDNYKTMDLDFMESVIWAFKRLHEEGLAYEGYRVLPYCWECETPLSNFETRQDDSYRDRTDPAVTVAFDVEAADGSEVRLGCDEIPAMLKEPFRILAWTTTPWTLPSNLAVALGPDLDYAVLERALPSGDRERLVVGADRLDHYATELEGAEIVATVKGTVLAGRRYRPLFPYFSSQPGGFRLLLADFVTTDEGTGAVHVAPGFGEDDQRLCQSAGIAVVCPVDERGRFTPDVPDFAGLQVFDANEPIIEALSRSGALLSTEAYTHSYPHCWRSDTALIYRAMSSWFVKVTAIKDRMVQLNQEINWVPENVRDGAFGKWLEGARDWSISRNRFWGAPIPVWKSDDPAFPRVDVYGSLDELEADFGVRPSDLHRPAIDELTRANPDDPTGLSKMRRIPDVLDCWFESGSMPFAQMHYPFENRSRFEANFPADFIVEYVGQTRGWFYTLHVLSTALFDCPPFRNCIAHGVVLGDDGRKLSKRLRNFPDPDEVFATQGADSMRWYLLSSPVLRGLDGVIERQALGEPVRLVENPIWNTWKFLSMYSNADHMRGRFRNDQPGLLDRYVLAKAASTVDQVTAAMDRYDLAGATAAISAFLDALTNWYVRRSRDRFWRSAVGGTKADKQDAFDTLHTVLEVLCRLAAPFLPMLSEAVYRGLTGERSVHLAPWPHRSELPHDDDLVADMDLLREVCSSAHSIRKAARLRARLPLRSLTVAGRRAERLAPLVDLVADEVNVKHVRLVSDVSDLAEEVLNVVPSVLGPRLGEKTQHVIAAVKSGDWEAREGGTVAAGGVELAPGEFSLRLAARDQGAARVLSSGTEVVSLSLALDQELEAEGTARDLVRLVQQARRESDLDVSDRIDLTILTSSDALSALADWQSFIAGETLAVEWRFEPSGARISESNPDGVVGSEGFPVWIELKRSDAGGRIGSGTQIEAAGGRWDS